MAADLSQARAGAWTPEQLARQRQEDGAPPLLPPPISALKLELSSDSMGPPLGKGHEEQLADWAALLQQFETAREQGQAGQDEGSKLENFTKAVTSYTGHRSSRCMPAGSRGCS